MTIKHLVLGGGGGGGIASYGVLKYLALNNVWNFSNIKSIYATSFGAILGTWISLNYNWNTLDDYLIKRPWNKIINIKPLDIINIWQEKGILNEDIVKIILGPLLQAKELSEDITLEELYNYNSIDFHMYTTNLNASIPTKVDISYKTHPDLELYKAIAMSMAFPLIFTPICYKNDCYIDGGLLNNFPLNDCLNNIDDIDSILAIKVSSSPSVNYINKDTSILNYIYTLVEGMRRLIRTDDNQKLIPNMIDCNLNSNNLTDWMTALTDDSIRQQLIELGEQHGKTYIEMQEQTDVEKNI